MRGFTALPRPVLLTLATLFAAATVVYGVLWMYYARHAEPTALLGIEYDYLRGQQALRITEVAPGTAAAQAGLQPGDTVLAINGRALDTLGPLYDDVVRGRPGDRVTLTIFRPDGPAPFTLPVTLQAAPPVPPAPLPRRLALELVRSYPVLFLAVGLPVLFLRLRDPHAWLLALLFAGFIAGGPILPAEGAIQPSLRGFALGYKVFFFGLLPGLFYYFFAVFPAPSPLDHRLPWLKSLLLGGGVLVAVPLALWTLAAGSSRPLNLLADWLGMSRAEWVFIVYSFGAAGAGLVSLVWNALCCATAEVRRKTRIIGWGTVVGFTPFLLLQAAAIYAQQDPYSFPFWIWTPCILAVFLIPLSFAYAVVKYRVLEIPALLKRSARYLLVQRGFVVLTFLLSVAAALIFALLISRYVQWRSEVAVPASVGVGVAFGILLAWAGAQVERRIGERIDRAFFRSAYDARHILEDLAEKTRVANSREELAALLQWHLNQALQPQVLVVYLEASAGLLQAERGRVLAGLESIPASHPLVEQVAGHGKPWDVPPPEAKDAPDLSLLAALNPECLVPVRGRHARLTGLVVLGPRLSEEPYSGEDKRLLASAASQAGIALESIRLAETIARRLEAERRVAQEIAIAKQVQEKLLPQKAPLLATLDYTGACIQARTVGGDYYDFLDLGPGRLGLVLADISGKGISAALLMAHLQATLRSQYALALEDLERLLESVNRLFCESTAPGHFATFFIGVYEDATRRLRYANCGHNPPLVLRHDGRVEWLGATATVLGLFENWSTTIEETTLAPGDTLVIYTDGVTDAASDEGEQFGEQRLLETVRAHSHLAASELLNEVATTVQVFSGREQEDDLTLLVARPH